MQAEERKCIGQQSCTNNKHERTRLRRINRVQNVYSTVQHAHVWCNCIHSHSPSILHLHLNYIYAWRSVLEGDRTNAKHGAIFVSWNQERVESVAESCADLCKRHTGSLRADNWCVCLLGHIRWHFSLILHGLVGSEPSSIQRAARRSCLDIWHSLRSELLTVMSHQFTQCRILSS